MLPQTFTISHIFYFMFIYRSVLEYDTETFTKISFLFEWNDFFFIIYSKYSIICNFLFMVIVFNIL